MKPTEIVFEIAAASEGGYDAKAVGGTASLPKGRTGPA